MWKKRKYSEVERGAWDAWFSGLGFAIQNGCGPAPKQVLQAVESQDPEQQFWLTENPSWNTGGKKYEEE